MLLITMATIKLKNKLWILSVPLLTVVVFITSCFITNHQSFFSFYQNEIIDFSMCDEQGALVAADHSDGFSSDVQTLVNYAKERRCTEIGDLILTEYDHRRAYLIHSLSKQILIRRIRLPIPKNEQESALATRIEQEAALHGIEVLFHTDDLCVKKSDDIIPKQEINTVLP